MHKRWSLFLGFVSYGTWCSLTFGDLIYESAVAGSQEQGQIVHFLGLDDSLFLAVNFEVTQEVTTGRIGGYLKAYGPPGPIFGAIVALSGAFDVPDAPDLSGSDVLAVTLIEPPNPDGEVSGNVRLTLPAGWYALVFGTGRFGATGEADARSHLAPIGNPRFYSIRQPDGLIIFQSLDVRVFVDSDPAPVFTRIADTNHTLIPGTTILFGSFAPPAIHEDRVAFMGTAPSSAGNHRRGVYRWSNGTLEQLANVGLFSPFLGGVQSFGSFVSIRRGNVVAQARGQNGQMLVARFNDQGIRTVADTNTKIPLGDGEFATLGTTPAADGENAAFVGSGTDGQQGIYKEVDGQLQRVADTQTPIPGGRGNFDTIPLQYASMDEGKVAFRGASQSDFQFGIYTDLLGSLTAVADLTTPIPGGKANFGLFGSPMLRKGKIAFGGADLVSLTPNEAGVYTNVSGPFQPVADRNTLIPGGTGTFASFSGDPSFDGQHVAFVGRDANAKRGVFTDLTGKLSKVIADGDRLDGRVMDGLLLGNEGIDVYRIAFIARFDDDTDGLFVARYPAAPGDVDGDGDVDLRDLSHFLDRFGSPEDPTDQPDHGVADVNGNREVNLVDWSMIAECLGGPDDTPACLP